MIFAATGHRPHKLGGAAFRLDPLRRFARRHVEPLGATEIISGLALGWDTAVALAALDLRIKLIVAIPFEGQDERWSAQDRSIYRSLREIADRVEVIGSRMAINESYHMRDRWMVDQGEEVLALHDGSAGGTGATVAYAQSIGRPIRNLWPQFRLEMRR